MYHVSAQGVDERMINVHYYYYYKPTEDVDTVRECSSGKGEGLSPTPQPITTVQQT